MHHDQLPVAAGGGGPSAGEATGGGKNVPGKGNGAATDGWSVMLSHLKGGNNLSLNM